ncbi:MAG: CHAT domain-containing protein [Symploca sp. SIO2E9]|nr:CHAT domain-containing protein [Symploca sp. SIO2E9]
MKNLNSFLKIGLALSWVLIAVVPSNAQSGNQSDITGPNPVEVIPTQDSEVDSGNFSDITGPNPVEVIPTQDSEADSGNQSDTTGPNPVEVIPTQDSEADSGNQSDTTGPNSVEITPTQDSETENIEEVQTNKVVPEVNRPAYESLLQQANLKVAVQLQEEFQAQEFKNHLGIELYGALPAVEDVSEKLYELWQQTGKKAAFIYVSSQSDQLETFTVFPEAPNRDTDKLKAVASKQSAPASVEEVTLRETLPEVSRQMLLETVGQFRREITIPRKRKFTTYLRPAQQLYKWLIAPVEAQLQTNEIDIVVFSMDAGLRSLPVAALHDGQQFLVEKYGVAVVPSFALADLGYTDVRQAPILAMGASKFTELSPLPAVPIELQNASIGNWQGESFLNERFTLDNFKTQNKQQQFGIIHLATHAEFRPGELSNSFIQFFDERLSVTKLRKIANELGWSKAKTSPIELLVLSACQTALGDEQAELGFAGLAVQSGVKSALASLWYVSDAGTLALMSEFYKHLSQSPVKTLALQQTQLAMLRGEVLVENGKLKLSDGETISLPPELAVQGNFNLSHPYFWSAFTMIGNWN